MKMLLIALLAGLNLLGLSLMAWDKSAARHHRRRIPERVLLGLAAVGGSVGVWSGIWLFRHKTLHSSFTLGVPFLLALQLAVAWFAGRLLPL